MIATKASVRDCRGLSYGGLSGCALFRKGGIRPEFVGILYQALTAYSGNVLMRVRHGALIEEFGRLDRGRTAR